MTISTVSRAYAELPERVGLVVAQVGDGTIRAPARYGGKRDIIPAIVEERPEQLL